MHELDRKLLLFLYAGDHRNYVYYAMILFSAIGGGYGLIGLVPVLLRPSSRRFGVALLITVLSTATLVALLKLWVGRVRPFGCVEGVHALCFAPTTDPSFPSGHAAGSFAFATFVCCWMANQKIERWKKWTVGGLVLSSAMAVGASRIVLGFHFPSDVLAGAIVGSAVGALGAFYTIKSRIGVAARPG